MDINIVFRWLAFAAWLTMMLTAGLYRRKAQSGESFSLEEEGMAIAIPLRLAGVVMWLTIPLMTAFPRLMAWSTLEIVPLWLRVTAAGIALLVVPPFAIWAQRSLGRNVSTTVVIRQEHQLIAAGPYRYIRHPLYTIGMLFFVSLVLITQSWLLLAGMAVGFIPLMRRTPKEEAKLAEAFGDAYREYQARTGRFLPKLFG